LRRCSNMKLTTQTELQPQHEPQTQTHHGRAWKLVTYT
jgi:hypothetical protein